jgi:hypothetical protein
MEIGIVDLLLHVSLLRLTASSCARFFLDQHINMISVYHYDTEANADFAAVEYP